MASKTDVLVISGHTTEPTDIVGMLLLLVAIIAAWSTAIVQRSSDELQL